MPPRDEPPNFQVVDLVRTAAIVPVLASHASGTLAAGVGLAGVLWAFLCRNNLYAVTLFFVVSGFLITRVIDRGPGGLDRPDLRHFYVRRAGRTIPLLLLFIALGLLILGWAHAHQAATNPNAAYHDPWFWISILTFTFNWYQIKANSAWLGLHWMVLWSLAVEEQFYLLYPLALRRFQGFRSRALLFGTVLLVGPLFRLWAYHAHPDNYWLSATATVGVFDQIAFGCVLYLVWKKYRAALITRPVLSGLFCVTGALTVFLTDILTLHTNGLDRVWALSVVAGGCALFLLGALQMAGFENRWVRVLSLPGKYSYGNYLLHTTVLFFTYTFLLSKSPVWGFPLFLGLCTLLTGFSFHYFEKPLNLLIRRRFDPESFRK